MKKKRVTQEDIARLCQIDQGSVSRILNKDTRDSFAKETIEKVFKAAREAGYLHPALISSNRRDSPRKRLAVTANIRVVAPDGRVFSEGSAEIGEFSMSGMLLKSLQLAAGSLPAEPHRFDLEVTSTRLKGFRARGRPIRYAEEDGALAIAIKFDGLDDANRQLLEANLK